MSPLGYSASLPPSWVVLAPRPGGVDRILAASRVGPGWIDNVSITRTAGPFPRDAAERARACERMDAALRAESNGRARVRACRAQWLGTREVLRVESEGLLPDVDTVQYFVPQPRGDVFEVTGSFGPERAEPPHALDPDRASGSARRLDRVDALGVPTP